MILMSTLLIGLVLSTALVYYDYRFRSHWTGYVFGYPLEGFDGQIFFTFDDGPSAWGKVLKTDDDTERPVSDLAVKEAILRDIPEYDFSKTATENLLDILKKHNVRAIFFLYGSSIEGNVHAPALIRRMRDEGHVIGNHSFTHRYATRNPINEVIEDFAKNHRLVASLTDVDMTVFRPPYGDWRPGFTKKFLGHSTLGGYAFPLFWTNLFKEWALKSSADLNQLGARIEGFRKSCKDGAGKIVLLHDVYIPAVILASGLIREAVRWGYKIGDPQVLVEAASDATELFRCSPFLYYLRNLKPRFRLKVWGEGTPHCNYHVD